MRIMVYLKAFGNTLLEFTIVIGGVYLLIQWFQNSRDDPKELLHRIILTSVLLAFTGAGAWVLGIKEYAAGNGTPAFAIFPFVLVFLGFCLSVLWTPSIGEWLLRPITGLLDGGNEAPDPKPYYSVARGLRAKGRYADALGEIQKQLDSFPDDFEGQMLMAEIHAADLHDLPAAEELLEAICKSSKQPAQNIAAVLNTLADWHLKYAKDHKAASRHLERIETLFPDSEAALGAAQRIAHLGTEEKPWSLHDRKKYVAPESVRNFGLLNEKPSFAPSELDAEEQAQQLVDHLTKHPADLEGRETLAMIYGNHYQRLDLATGQLEQMIAQPNANLRSVARWLNLLADLQIRLGNDPELARATLQRIVDRFPNSSAGELAQNRIDLLRLEVKAKEKSQAVKLGSYEENIGLKHGPPRHRS